MLKSVLFDMDGVIVNTEPLHYKSYRQVFDDINIEVPVQLYATFTGQSTKTISRQLVDHFKLSLSPETLIELKRQHFNTLFENDDSLNLIDGVLDLIKDYHNNGLTLVLASSATMENINKVFERFSLDQYFIAKLSGADLKASKPHPEIFENAAMASGFERHECMVIEDSTNGIKAAKSAGIFCVAYHGKNAHGQDYSRADMVINDFQEIAYPIISKEFTTRNNTSSISPNSGSS